MIFVVSYKLTLLLSKLTHKSNRQLKGVAYLYMCDPQQIVWYQSIKIIYVSVMSKMLDLYLQGKAAMKTSHQKVTTLFQQLIQLLFLDLCLPHTLFTLCHPLPTFFY